jgi:hypothetical protein
MKPEVAKYICNPVTKTYIDEEIQQTKDEQGEVNLEKTLSILKRTNQLWKKISFGAKVKNVNENESNSKNHIEFFSKDVDTNAFGNKQHNSAELHSPKTARRRGGALQIHLRGYLFISTYLAIKNDYKDSTNDLIEIVQSKKDMEVLRPGYLLEDEWFVYELFNEIMALSERLIFLLAMMDLPDVYLLISKRFVNLFIENNRFDYLIQWFALLKESLKRDPPTLRFVGSIMESVKFQDSAMPGKDLVHDIEEARNQIPSKEDIQNNKELLKTEPGLTVEKLKYLIQLYFQTTDENDLLMDIFKAMRLPNKTILYLLLDSKEQERLIKIANDYDGIVKHLSEEQVLRRKQYKLLILFDSMSLINIFNMEVYNGDLKTRSLNYESSTRRTRRKGGVNKRSIYIELCKLIKRGEDVESLCNVITHVNETYWDMPKLTKFFNCLQELLYSESTNWLVYIQNPLQFFMTLVNFFKEVKEQLDFQDKKISELAEDMMNFCINYIESANSQALMLNMFEKDAKELCFLDYAFMVGSMNLLEMEQIEGTLSMLWDQERHIHLELNHFMKIDIMQHYVFKHPFTMKTFWTDYNIQIHESDCFQMEYAFCSNSVNLKVLAEIIWPIPLIVFEFYYSMILIQNYLNNTLQRNWFTSYLNEYPNHAAVHGFLRASLCISCGIKSIVLSTTNEKPNSITILYNLIIGLNFFQFAVIPLFFNRVFWISCNTQTVYVITLMTYCLYNALAIDDIGVTVRIFFRMGLVVIFFGILSFR